MIAILNVINFVVKGSHKNEAYARCQLNNILTCCVAEEKQQARSTAETYSSPGASINPDPTKRPTTPTTEPAELSLRFETVLKYAVSFKKEKRILNGVADYTLCTRPSSRTSQAEHDRVWHMF